MNPADIRRLPTGVGSAARIGFVGSWLILESRITGSRNIDFVPSAALSSKFAPAVRKDTMRARARTRRQ
jgi:hypothetical protein